MYMSPSGKPIAPLGSLELSPNEDGSWDIGGFWCYEFGIARWFGLKNLPLLVFKLGIDSPEEIPDCVAVFAERFFNDPEGTMKLAGWSWNDMKRVEGKKPGVEISLGDLGL